LFINRLAIAVACFGLTDSPSAMAQNVDVNSLERRVEGFVYPDSLGNYVEYRIAGFAQPENAGGLGVRPRMFLMPQLRIPIDGVRFADEAGLDFVPTNCATRPARTVTLSVATNAALPNEIQRVAIGSALAGKNPQFYFARWPTNGLTGQPIMWSGAAMAPDVAMAIISVYQEYKIVENAQNSALALYDKYDVSYATLQQFSLDLNVGGETVATNSFKGSLIGGAPIKLTLQRPDTFTCNQVARGNYEVVARFAFNDTKSATINARFDARASLHSFIEETQKATTSQRNSGWKILGIGSRRSKMKASLDQTLRSETDIGQMENTKIVMVDADESMIRKFENAFFPSLSRDEAIANHLAAATEADSSNNPQLANVHRGYAAALTDGREDLETDAVGAAAALAKRDYASFIAKGVRFSESNTSRTNNFRRTIDTAVDTELTREWDQVMTITRLRESSMPVTIASQVLLKPTLGPLSGGTYSVPWFNNYEYPSARTGFLVGMIAPNGPLAAAGIEPGMLIFRIAGQQVKSMADVLSVVASLTPGEQISVVRFNTSGGVFPSAIGPQVQNGTTETITVTVGRRPELRAQ
jgi:hypothetical protein